MPIMRVKEIRETPSEERSKKLGEFRTELLRLRTMIKAGGSVENPGRIKELRKIIARILTIEREQSLTLTKANGKSAKKK
ncbi:MAG TPA: 50S ribosomal protein L29 [Candidatus Acidoferrum sp.]|nr:50S ribosomal protein L29 [Candidatus Acidoferrum sp.]